MRKVSALNKNVDKRKGDEANEIAENDLIETSDNKVKNLKQNKRLMKIYASNLSQKKY